MRARKHRRHREGAHAYTEYRIEKKEGWDEVKKKYDVPPFFSSSLFSLSLFSLFAGFSHISGPFAESLAFSLFFTGYAKYITCHVRHESLDDVALLMRMCSTIMSVRHYALE
jgi:hypothetical protein